MKKLTITILAALGIILFTMPNSNAGVFVGVSIGGPIYYYAPNPYYGRGYYNGYGHYYYHRNIRYYRH